MTITKEGTLASFYTVNKAPIKHLKVYFSPKQAGEGDSSPSNIRPIEGWNGIDIYQYGKNLFDINTMANRPGVMINNNTIIGSARNIRYYHNNIVELTPLFIPAGTTFIVHCTAYSEANSSTEGAGLNPWFYYEDGTSVRPWYTRNSAITPTYYSGIITAEQNIVKYEWVWYNNPDNIWHISDLQFEILSTATKYELYKNVTTTIDWSNDIGTIYGGYVDLVTGELVETWGSIDLGSINTWYVQTYENSKWFRATLPTEVWQNTWRPNVTSSLNNHPPHFLIDRFKIVSGSSIYYGTSGNNVLGMDWLATIRIKCDSYEDDIDAFKAAMNGIILYYEYATPITHQLTPTQLQTFIGQNNIWSNADRVEVEYDLAESNDELYRRRNIILQSAPHLETVSGNIANFNTDLVAPIKSAKFYFNPIQEGSGDPSPENAREISGWTGCSIYQHGKNLIDKNSLIVGLWWKDIIYGSTYYPNHYRTPLIPVKPGASYYLSRISGNQDYVSYFDKNQTYVQQVIWSSNSATKQIPDDIYYVGINIKISEVDSAIFQLAEQDINYTTFTSNITVPIDWTSNGTIYGGYVDLINGNIISTYRTVELSSLTWGRYSNIAGNFYNTSLINYDYNQSNKVLCDKLPVAHSFWTNGTVMTSNRNQNTKMIGITNTNFNGQPYSDINGFIAWLEELNPILVYPTTDEIVIGQLTPQQLLTLRGTNNIWSTANGQTEITYWTH